MDRSEEPPMEASYVIKRDGKPASVRFDAITDRNQALCSAAYGRHLSHVEKRLPAITQKVVRRFKNGMTTHALDMLTADVCVAQSTRHQDFSDLAARILVSDLQKRTTASFLQTVLRLDSVQNAEGLNVSRLHPEFVGIASRGAAEIDRRINFARDFRLTYFGVQTMIRSYLLRETGPQSAPVERPQHMYMRVALALCVGQPDQKGHEAPEDLFRKRLEFAFEAYDLLSTQRLAHASPTIFNAGTKHPQLASCFLLSADDDLNVVLQVDKDAGMISKWAGGVGMSLSRIRAEGALIKSTGCKSDGLRRYIMKLNSSQLHVNQSGFRPGAYALYLETWHADIFTFLSLGRFKDIASNAPDLKYALWTNDMFMEAVVEELAARAAVARGDSTVEAESAAGDWYLFSPDRAPDLDKAYGEQFRVLYRRYVDEKRYERVVKASTIMTEWFKTVAQKGNPYILFKDHINRKSNLSHYRTITNSNLCVAGGTRILTDKGQLPICTLVDREVRVWNGSEWSCVTVRQTSLSAALVRVTLNSGATLVCTPEHTFYDRFGTKIRAGNLAPGTQLEDVSSWPVVDGGEPFSCAYAHGLFCARQTPVGALLDDSTASLHGPPLGADKDSRLRWFEGYCDGSSSCGVQLLDGPLVLQTQECSIVELNFLRQIRLLLQTLGCNTRIWSGIPTSHFGCRGWRLFVTKANLETLVGLGFSPRRLDLQGGRGVRLFDVKTRVVPQVVSVSFIEIPAPTFCFTEPLRGRGVFEGILTGQCAEISIPSFHEEGKENEAEYGTCNLAAIPLASFVLPDARASNPGRARVDWEALIATAGTAVRNLDNIIDINFYPVEACRRSNLKHRPIALGVMGLADVLAKFRYAYGSSKARALDRALHAAIYYGAMRASSELGKERGNFASFEGSASQRGLLQPDLWVACGHLSENWEEAVASETGGKIKPSDWAELRKSCSAYLRNAYVTADMPTATSSQATGQNECFEPFTSNLYTRKTLAGEFTLLNPYLLAELESVGVWDEEMRQALVLSGGSVLNNTRVPPDIQRRYRTARELDQRLLTLHAKARNPFLSQSQSLNYYFSAPCLRDALTVVVSGWKEGLTTGCYYIHTQPAAGSAKSSVMLPAFSRQPSSPKNVEDSAGRNSASVCSTKVCEACSV
ncbi:ribonucleoside-diphosphate reductase [Elysia marginata]|uniref:Ribonucleoside-diphosphate reductase n=1 Tax=Elysia marginata TaxID=1093978 RepID=A0AAV4H3D6_9GAST|nr:ribonucleoside-diphosphate reductase [Elysia marginata]